MARTWRQIKFDLIERVLLPPALILLKLWVRTWRIDDETFRELDALLKEERLAVATLHGLGLSMLAFPRLCLERGRTPVILTSPSRDGLLMDAVVMPMGIQVIKGSSRSRAAPAVRGMIREVDKGKIALITIDGPRGPLAVPKPGLFRIARDARAEVYTVLASASHAIHFRKAWDRAFLPLPFAKLSFRFCRFEMGDLSEEEMTDKMQRYLIEEGRAVGCPIVEGLRTPREEEPPSS
jgi:hypothetical protein